ncbi:MAG: hypothetical protein MUE98_00275 [Rhodobacteraceae bacterium]|nr:hypothetical protein [Paracoccaceae bacterium]
MPRAAVLRLAIAAGLDPVVDAPALALVAALPRFTFWRAARRDWSPAEDAALFQAWMSLGSVTEAAVAIGIPRGHVLRRWQQIAGPRDRAFLRREGETLMAALGARARVRA